VKYPPQQFFSKSLQSRIQSGWVIVAVLFLILALAHPQRVTAQTQMPSSVKELQEWQKKVDQYRSGYSERRQQVEQQEGITQERLDDLLQSVANTSQNIQINEEKIRQANQDLQGLEDDLAIAEKAYEQKRTATVARLRFLQRQRTARGWTVLLDSHSFGQFLARRYQLRRVYEADQARLGVLKSQADQVNAKKDQIEAQKNQIALLTQQLLNQKQAYESQATAQEELLSRLTSNRRALEAAEAQLSQDSENLALWIQYRQGQGGRIAYGTGRMGVPSAGPITSLFGWRIHPVLGESKFHAGTDFGAEHGSPIYASDRGTVIFAGWYGGYGNAVVIDHGNSLTTLYGHASQLYVTAGQIVQRGQMIAAVGSTGLSTGPHLHFEVRQNGDPVDPLAFVS